MNNLATAINRLQSDALLARHFQELQQENQQLRALLSELQTPATGVRMLVIDSGMGAEPKQQSKQLLERAYRATDLQEKIQFASRAFKSDSHDSEPLIVRGQAYLRLISLAYPQRKVASDFEEELRIAGTDFDLAVHLDEQNPWAWMGKGDVYSWRNQTEAAALSYERTLATDPFFDIARERLIGLYTKQARRRTHEKQWLQALATLDKLLDTRPGDIWLPSQVEACALCAEVLTRLNRPSEALNDLSTVLGVQPSNTKTLLACAQIYHNRMQGRLAKDDYERACVFGSITACEELP